MPWAYYAKSHHDLGLFSGRVSQELLSFTLFAYRGLVYAAYARSLSRTSVVPIVYVAAAGRLAALEPLINSRDLGQLDFPRREYLSLIDLLDLPDGGFRFDSNICIQGHVYASGLGHLLNAFHNPGV